jgi:hypothetical protein
VKAAGLRLDEQASLPALPSVNPLWITAINNTIPTGTSVTGIDIRNLRIELSCSADDFHQAEMYRNALAETGLFEWVRFGQFNRQADGHIKYELILWVEHHETI